MSFSKQLFFFNSFLFFIQLNWIHAKISANARIARITFFRNFYKFLSNLVAAFWSKKYHFRIGILCCWPWKKRCFTAEYIKKFLFKGWFSEGSSPVCSGSRLLWSLHHSKYEIKVSVLVYYTDLDTFHKNVNRKMNLSPWSIINFYLWFFDCRNLNL